MREYVSLLPMSENLDEKRMQLWEHLAELRGALVRSLVAISLGFCLTYTYIEPILKFLERPLFDALPPGERHLYFTGITDKFFIYLKISIYSSIALTSPYLLYEVWRFISPGLYQREKRFVLPFLFLGSFFFFTGVAFAYYLVIPYGYQFLLNFGSPDEKAIITLTEYFKITTQLLLGMGAVFEIPVLMMLLARFGIIQDTVLSEHRGHAYIALSLLAAFITPTPDAFTMVLVLVPLYLLYETSILLVRWVGKPKDE